MNMINVDGIEFYIYLLFRRRRSAGRFTMASPRRKCARVQTDTVFGGPGSVAQCLSLPCSRPRPVRAA